MQWIKTLAQDEVADEDVTPAEAAMRAIALYKVEGEIFATDRVCTHGAASLCNGFLMGYEIECPLHQGRFDVRTGKGLCAPITQDIATYPVKIEDGHVFVGVQD
ncbi:MAG TPA: non-heme iron oxygenase ferredoxin subunit [Bordetella sp.]|uniref:non-heme iron oxygenase ferredoxin subunit n=1 Tax=Bordetella sp. TaxID=28081 RepID=UPI002ED5576A